MVYEDEKILLITDLDFGNRTVTNDAKNVISDVHSFLQKEGKQIKDYKVIYQDSTGVFDQLLVGEQNQFLGFRGIQVTDIEKAKKMIHG